jgi:hypothetical protein
MSHHHWHGGLRPGRLGPNRTGVLQAQVAASGQRERADDHPRFDIYDLHMLADRIDTTDPGSLRRWRAEQPVRLCLGKHNGRARGAWFARLHPLVGRRFPRAQRSIAAPMRNVMPPERDRWRCRGVGRCCLVASRSSSLSARGPSAAAIMISLDSTFIRGLRRLQPDHDR